MTLAGVLAIEHRRIAPPYAGELASGAAQVAALGEVVADQLDWVREGTAETPVHLLCTTILSMLISGNAGLCGALLDTIAARRGVRPVGIAQSYQCAGWGYALRLLGSLRRSVAITIVDIDFHDLKEFYEVPGIGAVGFGVTTILFDVPPGAELPQCDGPYANSAFTEFVHAIRRAHRGAAPNPTYIPFLVPALDAVARRLINAAVLAPNLHARHGHCWGADPWIGLVETLDSKACLPGALVTLGSVAYAGYFTLATLQVLPHARWRLSGVPASGFDAGKHAARWTHDGFALPLRN